MNHCVYCGAQTTRNRRVCQGHADLPRLDPTLNHQLRIHREPRRLDVLDRLIQARTR